MTAPASEREPLELLAEEYVERCRRGERPAVAEYARRHPELADRIRELFPTLLLMEQLGAAADAAPPGVPSSLGEYRIVREVGRGGMGVVYEAVQESLGRRVALKVLPAERCRGKFLERFRREARAAARLHHTNIVPVFGVGQDGGTHYYVMQYIDGRGLDRLLADARSRGDDTASFDSDPATLPLHGPPSRPPSLPGAGDRHRTIARLGVQAATALDYAHAQGVLHRDVKPSNLLLDGAGTLWVADFGLAKADDGKDLTNTDDLLGTLRYMAPERFRGHADPRCDVYSLGATLYELLARRPALDAPDRLQLMARIADGAAVPLRQIDPRVPRDLETVVAKAMAREPADRYATAGALADDLARFLDDRPIRARRAGPVEQTLRWCKRHPAVAALAAVVVLLLAITAGVGWWAAGRFRNQVETVSRAERDTTERLWEARLAQARVGRASRLPGQRFKGLEALAEAARIRPSGELRDEAIACLALADVRVERTWPEELATDRLEFSTGVAFDPALAVYAFGDAAGVVRVRATEGGRDLARLVVGTGPVNYLRFSPDGRYLAVAARGVQPCRVWEWRTGRVVVEAATAEQYGLSLDFHPDGSAVAVGRRRCVEVYALADGRRLRTLPLDFNPTWLAYEPRLGQSLAVCGSGGRRLAAVNSETGHSVADWDAPPSPVYAVAWQPGGALLAASATDGAVYTYDADGRAPRPPLRGHLLAARELAFSPDGDLLVTRGWDGTTRFWDAEGGQELLRVRGVSFLQFSGDGRRLAFRGYNSRELGVWEVAPRAECRLLYGHRTGSVEGHAGVAFAPGGRLLATGAADGVCLWDAATGRLLARLDAGPTRDVLFDPQGRYLLTAGGRGCRHYPLRRSDDDGGERWQVGPASVLPLPIEGQAFHLHCDQDGGRALVVDRPNQVFVIRPGEPLRPPVPLSGHGDVARAAFSPDGRYVATGTHRGTGVWVWDAESGRRVRSLPAEGSAGAAFTPDGRRLLVLEAEGAYRVYRVDGWALEGSRRDPDAGFTRSFRVAFAPGGWAMAETEDRVNLRLVAPATGRELAVLRVPESQNVAAYQFSPDGRYLAAVTVGGVVQVWDLTRLRDRLRPLGLDWPSADGAPADGPRGLDPATTLTVEVLKAD